MRVFVEEQRFKQKWLITLLAVSSLGPLFLVTHIFLNKNGMNIYEYLVTLSIIIASACLIFLFKLSTRIDEKGIHYKFFPFHFSNKTILWDQIKTAEVRTYNAFTEFGGYGMKGGRFWKKINGTAFNISGNKGIQLLLNNGKKILIGTQLEEKAKEVVLRYKK
ncbi:hypothetical protein [Flavicella sp.]|uniref:hypothetical protein n=1 Tax=Flavicella sp. TaxID=2957742 RepID=UPI00260564E7|nr:hypothetical protein [Flavicella sp.]MDG1803892.1 hypothetical protein [Flavicella sp.]MDG2279756.1 hypothetical protein [Flavicella sp.]